MDNEQAILQWRIIELSLYYSTVDMKIHYILYINVNVDKKCDKTIAK